jgi:uncharacterized membrane protein SpoIIM required for sporulation
VPLLVSKTIRAIVVLAVAGLLAFWLSAGAHTGWSMNRVPIEQTDEITGLVFTTYEERYIPGIEVLGGGLVLGALLFATTFFLPKKN